MRSRNRDLMKQIKEYVKEYALSHNGISPTTINIAETFNISRAGGFRYLKYMDEEGMIKYQHGRVIGENWDPDHNLAQLSASYIEGNDEIKNYFSMPACFVNHQEGKYFTVTVMGDSMVDAGIGKENLVICRAQETADAEDIVAAKIRDGGCVLRRYCRDDEGPFLWAENNGWNSGERLTGRDFEILGVAVRVLRDLAPLGGSEEERKIG